MNTLKILRELKILNAVGYEKGGPNKATQYTIDDIYLILNFASEYSIDQIRRGVQNWPPENPEIGPFRGPKIGPCLLSTKQDPKQDLFQEEGLMKNIIYLDRSKTTLTVNSLVRETALKLFRPIQEKEEC